MLMKKIFQIVAAAGIMMAEVMDGEDIIAQATVGALNRMPDEFLALPAMRIHTASLVDVGFDPHIISTIAIDESEQFPDRDLIVEFPYSNTERDVLAYGSSYPKSTLRVMSSFIIAGKDSYVVMSSAIEPDGIVAAVENLP